MNTQKIAILGTVGAAIALLSATVAVKPANAQEVVVRGGFGIQADKNVARTVGIGLGGAAVYELAKGHDRSALALGVGAIVAGERYEADRRIENYRPVVAPVACYPVRPAFGVTYVEPVHYGYREPVRYGYREPVRIERPVVVVDRFHGNRGFEHIDRDRHDGWGHR